jgi:hypothetical protein
MADWEPADGHKMHFPQLPDEAGWDVNATYPEVLADDWQCSESGYIKDFHFWGSWRNGNVGEIQKFIISIHADIPAASSPTGYSMPGEIYWEQEITVFDVMAITASTPEGWYDPGSGSFIPDDHIQYFQYNVFLDSAQYFWQYAGNIYWMNISAVVVNPVTTQWGWKSSTEHWNDDGVYRGGASCVAPDIGTGTIEYPADCDFTAPEEKMMIIDGFPPGTTIEGEPTLYDFFCNANPMCSMGWPSGTCEGAGGMLGGTVSCFEASLELVMTGTGLLAGFNRVIRVPMFVEIHHASRNPGDPIQTFVGEVYRYYGELFGDPDFCTFRVTGGSDYGLPGPGQTELTELPSGLYAVESFFDITYQIEFEGCPGSVLDGFMGTTTATIRMVQGGPEDWFELYEPPDFGQSLDLSFVVTGGLIECDVAPDSTRCLVVNCPVPSDDCQPTCVDFDPLTGDVLFITCECLPPDACHVDIPTSGPSGCVVPDNGTGTADLPPAGCDYQSPDEYWMIIDGLPPGTTIEMEGILMNFLNMASGPGGTLGGEKEQFDATLDLTVRGTGSLAGFNRHLAVPITCETHSAPRNPGDPVQTFATVMYDMTGELFGDPDFCTFRIRAGNNYGLPSPGQTVLTELPSGDFAVESFFDVTYQIEFEGCPASVLEDYMGTTTATIRIQTSAVQPSCAGECPPGYECVEIMTENPDGTIGICCECVLQECEPNNDSSACNVGTCSVPGEECQPTCVRMDKGTGDITVMDCVCQDSTLCQVDVSSAGGNPCEVPDNGTGTADLPPVGCTYIDPVEDWIIIDGLPPGTTIEMDGILMNFFNISAAPGGLLGGELEQFDATLDLTVTGTGSLAGFNRHLAVPVSCETHSAPRNPGDPVQSFTVDFYSLQGQLFGDPDFCELIIVGGTKNGMPSPGQTVLTELPSGDYAVESFFDVTYQIQFEGCPASVLEDYMGTTTATIRIQMGAEPPDCAGDCPPGYACEQIITDNGDGTVDVCCQCVVQVCEPNNDSSACNVGTCSTPGEECQPGCVNFNAGTGETIVVDCVCQDSTLCHVSVPDQVPDICSVPDNGSGTADLPPVGCDYVDPDEDWMIIDGLPPQTTIEMDGILMDFFNIVSGAGGSLGGEYEQFEATLDLTVSGTGDLAGFNRHLAIPISCETHSGPRNPGDPIQSFATVIYEMTGELFGDPDFCTFRIRAGINLGLPSPGHTVLTELGSGDYAVESFFDITYQIEFEGCPASVLEDYMGTTTGSIRVRTGAEYPPCAGECPEGEICEQSVTINGDGTVDICCTCVPLVCEPTLDSSSCRPGSCINPNENCMPVCAQMDIGTGGVMVLDCACQDSTLCHVDLFSGGGSPCEVPDNGTGTADLPPVGCDYTDPDEDWLIRDGLPPGTTIEMDGIVMDYLNIVSGSGGSLGGEYEQFEATLDLTVMGTGSLAGFNRHLAIPITCETHSAPRNPGDPVQSFTTVMYEMTGELFGDPDFCTFRIRAGDNYSLPSPGQTVLTELPSGDFAVESFFDITYQIEFEGCPASVLEDYMGTTTATIRIQLGAEPPICAGDCPPGEICERVVTVNGDGTVDVCCQCVPLMCEPNQDSSGCNTSTCVAPEHECMPICAELDLATGQTIVVDCACQDSTECYVDVPEQTSDVCVVDDNGTGTANLPPVGCEYLDPYEDWMIIDGLPPGTTIEMDGIFTDFFNIVSGSGGSLGGEYQQFEAALYLDVSGTGELAGFNRHLAIPITCETHSAPRTPGDPVQTFSTDMYQMTGELFGDPDFCTFRITAGSDNGLPGPGETTLRQLPDDQFAVESFFDITYQIEFEGCPGSPLEDYMGTTTATIRVAIESQMPVCAGDCPEGQICQEMETFNPDGTIEICCSCMDAVCDCTPGNANGDSDINVGDAVYIISYVFKGGPAPIPYATCSGDANCDCQCNVGDAVFLISYVFKGGPAPCSCEEWLSTCGPPLRK